MAFTKTAEKSDSPMRRKGGIRRRKKVCVFCGKDNVIDCQVTSSLDRYGQSSLMLSAVAGDATRKDLTSLGYVSLQLISVLVINHVVLTTKYTNLFSSADPALSSHRGIGLLCGLSKSHR